MAREPSVIWDIWNEGLKKGLLLRLTELKKGNWAAADDVLFNTWSDTLYDMMRPCCPEGGIPFEECRNKEAWNAIARDQKLSMIKGRRFSFERFKGLIEVNLQEYILGADDS